MCIMLFRGYSLKYFVIVLKGFFLFYDWFNIWGSFIFMIMISKKQNLWKQINLESILWNKNNLI